MATGGWEIATAVGTIGATVAAVTAPWLIDWKRRQSHPQLLAHFDQYAIADEGTLDSPAGQKWLRLAVTNAPRRDTAQAVTALVLGCEELPRGSSGSGGVRRWLANPALGWANGSERGGAAMSIPPGVKRYVDVGTWGIAGDGTVALFLQVKPQPLSGRHILPAGRHRITVDLAPENGSPTTWEIDVAWESPRDEGTPGFPLRPTATVCQVCQSSVRSRVLDRTARLRSRATMRLRRT